MKSLQEIKEQYKSKTLDGRDIRRLAYFIPEPELAEWGITLSDEYVGKHVPLEFNRENVLAQLREDVEFGFRKALNRRSLSAANMFAVVRMWCWVLEEGMEDWSEYNYAQYGLPLFKAVAVKYGFDIPIGDDTGSEYKYSEYGE